MASGTNAMVVEQQQAGAAPAADAGAEAAAAGAAAEPAATPTAAAAAAAAAPTASSTTTTTTPTPTAKRRGRVINTPREGTAATAAATAGGSVPVPYTREELALKEQLMQQSQWHTGDDVLVFHFGQLYNAKVLAIELTHPGIRVTPANRVLFYFVHYSGWNERWDEWVDATRILKKTPSHIVLQKELRKLQKASVREQEVLHVKRLTTAGEAVGGVSKGRSKRKPTKAVKYKKGKGKSRRGDDDDGYGNGSGGGGGVQQVESLSIHLPRRLQDVLIQDWKFVNYKKALLSLPRPMSVADILYHHAKTVSMANREQYAQVLEQIEQYFCGVLGQSLLYRFERPQYGSILKTYPQSPLSEIYGGEHLLRFMVHFSETLQTAKSIPLSNRLALKQACMLIVDFLLVNADVLFKKEYEPTTGEYIRDTRF